MSTYEISKLNEEEAHVYLEKLRWPDGATCPKCESKNCYMMTGKSTPLRTWRCRDCRMKFTVRKGTIFEDSHIPLNKWLQAFAKMCAAKKGVSALQLQRELDLGSYRTAWHMAHRIRYAMTQPAFKRLMEGAVEADETYYGPRTRTGKRGRGSERKTPVVALVERGGEIRTFVVPSVSSKNLGNALRGNVAPSATLYTDQFAAYRRPGREFAAHETVDHGRKEYARGPVHVNTAESYFGLLKRGLAGNYHFVSAQHLARYCNEFAFRWNHRHVTDAERMNAALAQTEGKRLMYRRPKSVAS